MVCSCEQVLTPYPSPIKTGYGFRLCQAYPHSFGSFLNTQFFFNNIRKHKFELSFPTISPNHKILLNWFFFYIIKKSFTS